MPPAFQRSPLRPPPSRARAVRPAGSLPESLPAGPYRLHVAVATAWQDAFLSEDQFKSDLSTFLNALVGRSTLLSSSVAEGAIERVRPPTMATEVPMRWWTLDVAFRVDASWRSEDLLQAFARAFLGGAVRWDAMAAPASVSRPAAPRTPDGLYARLSGPGACEGAADWTQVFARACATVTPAPELVPGAVVDLGDTHPPAATPRPSGAAADSIWRRHPTATRVGAVAALAALAFVITDLVTAPAPADTPDRTR